MCQLLGLFTPRMNARSIVVGWELPQQGSYRVLPSSFPVHDASSTRYIGIFPSVSLLAVVLHHKQQCSTKSVWDRKSRHPMLVHLGGTHHLAGSLLGKVSRGVVESQVLLCLLSPRYIQYYTSVYELPHRGRSGCCKA